MFKTPHLSHSFPIKTRLGPRQRRLCARSPGPLCRRGSQAVFNHELGGWSHWLVVWNMTFIFPYIGNNNNPIWLSYFSEGLKPPTVHKMRIWFFKLKFHFYDMVVVVSTVCISIIVKPPSRCSQALRCSNHRLRSCGIVSLPLIWMNNHDTSQ